MLIYEDWRKHVAPLAIAATQFTCAPGDKECEERQAQQPQASDPMVQPAVPPQPAAAHGATNDQFFERLAVEEGFRGRVYNDTSGNPTIGYGHHLNRSPRSRAAVDDLGLNYDGLRSGAVTIDQVQGRALFDVDLADHLDIARRHVPAFDTLPAEVQLALGDAAFRTDLQGSPNAVDLMNQNQWEAAAAEYIDNDEYRASRALGDRHGVWQRMDRNAAAWTAYGQQLSGPQN